MIIMSSMRGAFGCSLMASTAALALLVPASAKDVPTYDIIIRNGTIIDGSGLPGYSGDVAIADGHIVAVGDIGQAKAAKTIDANGLVVAPGFINLHSHAEPDAVSTAVNMLTQGVTTEVINADGSGEIDIAGQLRSFASKGLAENIGAYIGFNAIWESTMGERDQRPTAAQISAMRATLETNLKAGAWGVASGLDYRPAYYAKPEEVVSILSVAKSWRTNFPNHDRLRPEDNLSSVKGMEETVLIAEQAGLVPVITHIKSAGKERGNAANVLKMVSAATARGAWTAIDIYPYLAGQTALQAFLVPGWAADGGNDAMLARFKDPMLRPKLVEAAEYAIATRLGGVEGIALPGIGKRLTDIMAAEKVGAGEAVLRTLERDPSISAIMTFGKEEDVVTFLKYPDTAVACDCGATIASRGHPRHYGSFPKVLGHYARDTGAITLEDAVRKMTALPAAVIGMVDRGRLAPGMRADVTLFDPRTVRDRATFEAPTLKSDGIRHVIVNGVAVLSDGAPTGAKSGAVLLRDAHMPSRPMMPAAAIRSVTATAASADYAVDFQAAQGSGQRYAAGKIKLIDARSGRTWIVDRLGVLQTGKGWASVTAILRDKSGSTKAATLTLDHADGGAETPVVSVMLGNESAVVLPGKGSVGADMVARPK
jgi:N-acyl-D-aspartate/D-glutamate deacylase